MLVSGTEVGMNLSVLKELDDVTGRLLFMFERPSNFGKYLMAWKRLNVAPVFKNSKDYPSCYRLVASLQENHKRKFSWKPFLGT